VYKVKLAKNQWAEPEKIAQRAGGYHLEGIFKVN